MIKLSKKIKSPLIKDAHTFFLKKGVNIKSGSDPEIHYSLAKVFLKGQKVNTETPQREETSFDMKSFIFPKGIKDLERWTHVFEFENFVLALCNLKEGRKPEPMVLITKRQASPPIEVYNFEGHCADINIRKMEYSYLY